MNKLRRTLQGKIITVSGTNTMRVLVERKQQHPLYKKVVRKSTKYLAHVINPDLYKVGDLVVIGETRPISKNKSWEIISKVGTEK